MTRPYNVAFSFIGGVHHVAHTMPIACNLADRDNVRVSVFAADQDIATTAAKIANDLRSDVAISLLDRPRLTDLLFGPHRAKLPLLWRNRRLLNSFDALVIPERTSLALQNMGVKRPRFINLPHGAGDRAISVDPRYRRFDRILVAGPKTAARMADNDIEPACIRQVGYPKAEYLAGLPRQPIADLDPSRPLVFYNPHFRRGLSSLDSAHVIVQNIAARGDVNLIVAPHIRSFEGATRSELEGWHGLAIPGRVAVDTGSPRMIDMSYVAAADLYLGDVSSQVYEFLLLGLRPCVFVNAHDVDWRDDLSYRHWYFGDVAGTGDVAEAVSAAFERHVGYVPAQERGVAETFVRLEGSAESAADSIVEVLAAPR